MDSQECSTDTALFVVLLMAHEERRAKSIARSRQWRLDHPDQFSDWFRTNRDKVKASRQRCRTQRIQGTKAWRAAKQEHVKTYRRTYRQTHQAEIAARAAKYSPGYYARTKQEHIDRAILRRVRQIGAPLADFTNTDWEMMKRVFHYRCAYCGKRLPKNLTRDHIQPLSQGGSHTITNIVPACRRCNARKHTGPPPCPVQMMLPLKMR